MNNNLYESKKLKVDIQDRDAAIGHHLAHIQQLSTVNVSLNKKLARASAGLSCTTLIIGMLILALFFS